ncbi:sterol carrier protein domain-containing protein [Brevibacterium sp. JNUCC-42]|nr:sterol carrier protein domain-containing protein [Brevibacterium sp. JNUCC-42]
MCKCKLSVQDDLIESNNARVIIHFTNGFAQIVENEDYEVEIGMNVGEFSSLLMGAIDFKSLVRYGLATLSKSRCVLQVFNRNPGKYPFQSFYTCVILLAIA